MPADPPFAGEGGLVLRREPDEDPMESLDDLMAVVEVLCGTWPQRDPFGPEAMMLL